MAPKLRASVLSIITTLFLVGCGPKNDDKDSIEHFIDEINANRIGNGGDYWIETNSGTGINGNEWEKIVLVFGYAYTESSEKSCQHMILGLKKFDANRSYRCILAN
jgi:hypothetical protein